MRFFVGIVAQDDLIIAEAVKIQPKIMVDPKRAETLGPRRIPKVIMSSCLVHRLQGGSNKVTRIYTTVCFLTSMCQNVSRFVIFSTANFYIRRRKVSRAFFFISHVVVMSHLDMWLTEEYKDLNAHL